MRTYESFNEIERDLKKIGLERDIAFEELKIVKHDFEGYLEPLTWINSLFKKASKYGILLLIKKIMK